MSYFSSAELSFSDQRASLFIGAERVVQRRAGSAVIFGAGFDGTTSFRPGTRFGPDAIRQVSDGIETYSPAQQRDLEDFGVLDAGNLDLPFGSPAPAVDAVARAVRETLGHQMRPVMLGGEHSLTPGAVQAAVEFFPDLVVIQLDAHADLRAEYLGEAYSHACAMRRCLDVLGGGEPSRASEHLLQVGIRSGTREEFAELRESGRYVAPTASALAERVAPLGQRPVYLTVDLDIFDPAYFPGTGTPEPGGISWQEFDALRAVLGTLNIIGMDIMELAPQLDPTGVSSVLAAKVLRELLLATQPM